MIRNINYIPLRKDTAIDLSKFCIAVSNDDLLLVLAKSNSKHKDKMQDVIGKMAILDYLPEINLLDLSRYLAFMNIKELNIISINLSPKVEEEIFIISDSPRVTYTEMGVLHFIEEIGAETSDFFF